jgi:hypothetical protein
MNPKPEVAFANLCTCLTYGLYYNFFGCTPRVYIKTYKFTYQKVRLSFHSVPIVALVRTVLLLLSSDNWLDDVICFSRSTCSAWAKSCASLVRFCHHACEPSPFWSGESVRCTYSR